MEEDTEHRRKIMKVQRGFYVVKTLVVMICIHKQK